jgi:4-hydroxy-tetrahydrodipicolinate synthase
MKIMFTGSIAALPTPFRGGDVDEQALQGLVQWHIDQGTQGLIVLGTTGEAPTMSDEEHFRVIRLVMEATAGRIPVMAGTGTNHTAKVIYYTQQAKAAGADAALIVTPYYNRPSQEGIYQHYKAIHDAADLPLIMYNIPSRSMVDMSIETITRLAKLPKIVGIKDSNPDLKRPVQLRMALGDAFCLLSGDEPTGLAFMASGGSGVTSSTANVIPAKLAAMHRAWREGDVKRAMALHLGAMPIHLAMYCETNPVPLKYMLHLMGKCRPDVRLPMWELSDPSKAIVRRALETCAVLVDRAA